MKIQNMIFFFQAPITILSAQLVEDSAILCYTRAFSPRPQFVSRLVKQPFDVLEEYDGKDEVSESLEANDDQDVRCWLVPKDEIAILADINAAIGMSDIEIQFDDIDQVMEVTEVRRAVNIEVCHSFGTACGTNEAISVNGKIPNSVKGASVHPDEVDQVGSLLNVYWVQITLPVCMMWMKLPTMLQLICLPKLVIQIPEIQMS